MDTYAEKTQKALEALNELMKADKAAKEHPTAANCGDPTITYPLPDGTLVCNAKVISPKDSKNVEKFMLSGIYRPAWSNRKTFKSRNTKKCQPTGHPKHGG